MSERITFKAAIDQIFRFFTGEPNEKKKEEESKPSSGGDIRVDGESDREDVECTRCGAKMNAINIARNDFIDFYIYACPKCKMTAEYQFSKDNTLNKLVYIFNPMRTTEAIYSENLGFVSYGDFSLARLWSVCGELCYPALIKSGFLEDTTSTKMFVKVNAPNPKVIEGYVINEQNIIGEIKIDKDEVHSIFFNPYIARLPKPDFLYLSIPTTFCKNLESVMEIRFSYDNQEISTGIYSHQLNIIRDVINQCCGFEIYIRFITHGCDIEKSMTTLIEKVDLKHLLLDEDINAEEGYSIQAFHLIRHTLSATARTTIRPDERISLYDEVFEFFNIFDKTNT